ncbi:MAG: type II toxin-antitoxin system RelE/ParE family toxin [Victivallaceae bacterium]|nr:type II toxin-antitoxin system RelE/ParE family toxin [Victivallaceae bacterium]
MIRSTLTTAAFQEFEDAVEYYESCEPELGKEFVLSVQEALRYISEYPQAWPVVRKEIRRYLISRFPYAILYYVDNDLVTVIAIMHSKRQPDYWVDRK